MEAKRFTSKIEVLNFLKVNSTPVEVKEENGKITISVVVKATTSRITHVGEDIFVATNGHDVYWSIADVINIDLKLDDERSRRAKELNPDL